MENYIHLNVQQTDNTVPSEITEYPELVQLLQNNKNDKKFDVIFTKLDRLEQNQQKILKELACLHVLLEKTICKSTSNDKNNTSKKKQQMLAFEPINDKEGIEKLNDVLKDADTFNDYVDTLSIICGTNTKIKAIDHCYMLVDKFFTRHFFTLCSWAGGSKVPNMKFAFKFYENILALFFKLIHKADPQFTLEECEEFFKGVIRNSLRRYTSANIRTSRSKNRPKKIYYNNAASAKEKEKNENTKVDDENEGEEQIE